MDGRADLDWVTRFDETPTKRPRSRGLTALLSALFGGGAVTAITLLVTALTRPAEEESGRGATLTPTAAPPPAVVQTSVPSVLPSGCAGLYSESLTVTLEQIGFELQADYDGPWHSGSADAELRALLSGAELDCHWTNDDMGLLTKVAEIDGAQQSLAVQRIESLGYTRLTEHGGVRYVIEREAATGPSGESHFFRDGVWIATHWLGYGHYGYTADMARSVFD